VRISATFWAALLAIVLALSAVAVSVAKGHPELSDVLGPAAITLMCATIAAREWTKSKASR
jgi:hypothetical protein